MREATVGDDDEVPPISSAAFATFDLKLVRVVRLPDGVVIRDTLSSPTCRKAWNVFARCRPRTTPSGARCSGATSRGSRC
jgi:hypothetical protein